MKTKLPDASWHSFSELATIPRIVPIAALMSASLLCGQPTTQPSEKKEVPVEIEPSNEIVQLSPFEVTGDTKGYFASNTLSGTRLNTKLENLGASITVVTKQQMEDFSLLNINDIFLYEANTEGTANFTDVTLDRAGTPFDNVASGIGEANPTKGQVGSNRIRGIGNANIGKGNFATSGRVPIESFNVESVEISRGPNSSIFGLGNTSGTVNIIPIQANPQVLKTKIEMRADSYGGWRYAIDHNQPIVPKVLALRFTAIDDSEGFERQPAVNRTKRYNAMMTFKPFKGTTLRASYERYRNFARLPNNVTPTDRVTQWIQSGRPTWDPVTWTVNRNGQTTVVPFNSNQTAETAALGPGLASGGVNLYNRPSIFVNPDGSVGMYMVSRRSGNATPNNWTGNIRFIESDGPVRQGINFSDPALNDRSLYDWTSVNLLAPNFTRGRNDSSIVEIDQIIINTPRTLLAAQVGWYKEEDVRYRRDIIGSTTTSPLRLHIDVNERLLDGTSNPYFLSPYIPVRTGVTFEQPLDLEIFRGQVAYQLKLAQEDNWLKWLGDHSFSGYAENNRTYSANFQYRPSIISDHAWAAPGTNRANGPTGLHGYYRFYVGDGNGANVDTHPAQINGSIGSQTFRWYNGATQQWVNENVVVGDAFWEFQNFRRSDSLIKTFGGVWQAELLKGRIVTTLGLRRDESYNRIGQTFLASDGISRDSSNDKDWPEPWIYTSGDTVTKGVVVRPFASPGDLAGYDDAGGAKSKTTALARSIAIHYNEADSFLPARLEQNLYAELIPNPSGKGKDYGISVNLNNRFVLRFNQYDTTQLNSRETEIAVLAQRLARVETNYNNQNDTYNLYGRATHWVNTLSPGLTGEAREAEIARYTGLPVGRQQNLLTYFIGETSGVKAKGKEIEINYNPTNYWTVKAAIAQQISIQNDVAINLRRYLEERMPFYKSLIDPVLGTPWYTTNYGSADTAESFTVRMVTAPLELATAGEGKPRTQVREWRANVFTTLNLNGITDHEWLSKMSVSGAVRWEDKASIGTLASATDPNVYDPNRPVYDKARAYFDFGVSYRTKIASDRIRLRVQLNVRNAFEGGRLQPIGALPNGEIYAYRIVDPRLVMLTTALEF